MTQLLRIRRLEWDLIRQRVADIFGTHPVGAQKFTLEGKQAEHQIDRAMQICDPPLAPGPDRGADKVCGADAILFQTGVPAADLKSGASTPMKRSGGSVRKWL